MISPSFTALLHLFDPTLPIGGYSHSGGLETYTQEKIVNNAATAANYIQNMLSQNVVYNDAAFVHLAYQAAIRKDWEELKKMDAECSALKSPKELRQASHKLGIRLLKIFRPVRPFDLASQYENYINESPQTRGHYCLTFGIYGALLNIPEAESVAAFLYNAATGMVTNAVKLIPLGQIEGQRILFDIQEMIPALTEKVITLERKWVGLCNIGFDIRCMQHERLYSRLYMS